MNANPRIICVSNRLPLTATTSNCGQLEFQPSSGGLVTAMGPVLRMSRGTWIGWPGTVTESDSIVSEALAQFSAQSECDVFPVFLDPASVSGFYQGFSNSIIWPLFHDLQSRCRFESEYWGTYRDVQTRFRDAIVPRITEADLIWVHDFHLMGLGQELRQAGVQNKICFFFHTPFPSPDIFSKLPWREEVLGAMLDYDLIGFQTKRDEANFVSCLASLASLGASIRGQYRFVRNPRGRECCLGVFPISIDINEFEEIAKLPSVAEQSVAIRADMNVEHLLFSIDRLDYTKGIPARLKAFRRLLEIEPTLKKKIALLQVVVPSRTDNPEYQQLLSEIEQLVTQINGAHAVPGWVPVHHLYRSLTREELVAMYRAADVALVTPLKDGMNLVAKEYCACRINNGGALVLSEFAGAADELAGSVVLVNPYDVEGVAKAISSTIAMPEEQLRSRMKAIRDRLRQADVFDWARSILKAAGWEWPSLGANPRPLPSTIWERLRKVTRVLEM